MKDFLKGTKVREVFDVMGAVLVVVISVCVIMILFAALIKTIVDFSKSQSYDTTSDLSQFECKPKYYWLKSNSDSVTLYLFADEGSERWYAEVVIDGQKIETKNAATACQAIDSVSPLAKAYMQSLNIANGEEDAED